MKTLKDYLAFSEKHPALFVNPPQGGFAILLQEDEIRDAEAQMVQKLRDASLPTEWAQVGIVYQDQYVLLLRDAVCFPDGSLGTYIRSIHDEDTAPGVIILPVWQGKVLLLRHFRHATRTWHLEIPRGFGEKGYTTEENARRELYEELKATPSHLVELGKVYPDTGMTSECDELFFAEVEAYGNAEAQEAIAEILPTAVPEFEHMLRENEITDGFTLTAYARAKLRGLL